MESLHTDQEVPTRRDKCCRLLQKRQACRTEEVQLAKTRRLERVAARKVPSFNHQPASSPERCLLHRPLSSSMRPTQNMISKTTTCRIHQPLTVSRASSPDCFLPSFRSTPSVTLRGGTLLCIDGGWWMGCYGIHRSGGSSQYRISQPEALRGWAKYV
jgi:hypothetical protein